jgi:hypothetical protein
MLTMTEISTGGDLVTYINVFTVAPALDPNPAPH